VEKILAVLTEIEQLTLAQRGLIGLDDNSALEQNLARKEVLIQTLGEFPDFIPDSGTRALLNRIADAERENIQAARDALGLLRGSMKKTQEGMTTVRGYDPLSSGIDATYIDKKQ
jgi:hypothetical protein